MAYSIENNRIVLTRGDSLRCDVKLYNKDGTEYIPNDKDSIRFAMKKSFYDQEPLLFINIPIDTMILKINAEDTKPFDFGRYYYDMQITKSNGDVDTFITKGIFLLTEEVD